MATSPVQGKEIEVTPEMISTGDDLLIEQIQQTLMGFRLEDFDRQETRQCALALLGILRPSHGQSSS